MLAEQLKKVARESWLNENRDALDTLNEFADENGLFSDSYRKF